MSFSFSSAAVLHSALPLVFPVICAGLLLVAAARDVASRTIPNSIPLLLTVIGIGLQLQGGTLPAGLFAAGLVFFACALGWRIGLMGGGDVKLLAALALCVPSAAVLSLLTATGLAGGVLGLAYLALRRLPHLAGPALRGCCGPRDGGSAAVPRCPTALRSPSAASLLCSEGAPR
jgi:Flp pilus assembly protein protease CpaA